MKRYALSLGLLLLCALPCCKQAAPSETDVEVAVQAEHPEVRAIAQTVSADAVLFPLAQATLSPRISAPVLRFYVQRGSHVKQGQLLATLEHRDLAAAAVDTQGSYLAAQAALASTRGAQIPEEIRRAELDVKQADATQRLEQSIMNARQKLFAGGAIPGRDLDTATANLAQAQAACDVAAEHLQALLAVGRKAMLEQAQGAVESAAGKHQGSEAQASYAEIRSPLTGVVTDRPLFAGETAGAGIPLLTVMDTSALLAKLHLAQSVAQVLHEGAEAWVTVPGVEEPVKGIVSLVSPALDPGSTTLEVWVRLQNHDGNLKAGTPVHVRVTGQVAPSSLVIPASAVLSDANNGQYVMLLGEDGAAHKRAVTLGIHDMHSVQVLTGLQATDTVIVQGSYGLDDGTKVKRGIAGEQ